MSKKEKINREYARDQYQQRVRLAEMRRDGGQKLSSADKKYLAAARKSTR